MKKILIPFDGTQFSQEAFDFAVEINRIEPVLLIGVFVPLVSYSSLWSYAAHTPSGSVAVPLLEKPDSDEVESNIERFALRCNTHNLKFTVHKDFYDFALPELKKESRFADLLIIGSESFLNSGSAEDKINSLRHLIHIAECPVVVVPDNFIFPSTNIIAYDGSESSVFAMRQFYYLFPQMAGNPTKLVYCSDKSKQLPEYTRVKELARQHYPNLEIRHLHLPKNDFRKWVSDFIDPIVITGSYGRSDISEIFTKSFVNSLIWQERVPAFIAHA